MKITFMGAGSTAFAKNVLGEKERRAALSDADFVSTPFRSGFTSRVP